MTTTEQAQLRCDEFNTLNPIGTPVVRYKLINPQREPTPETVTRSEAWVMGGHSPMVLVKGFSGGVHLDAIRIAPL